MDSVGIDLCNLVTLKLHPKPRPSRRRARFVEVMAFVSSKSPPPVPTVKCVPPVGARFARSLGYGRMVLRSVPWSNVTPVEQTMVMMKNTRINVA
jgi:hypothetical protein